VSTVETETTEDVIIRGVNITKCISEIADVGYIVVPDFVNQEEIAKIRHSFDTEVPMTEMRAIGVNTGKTMRAHNLLAKTRAVDWLFLDERVRGIVDGVLGGLAHINVTTLFNVLPGEEKMYLHPDDGLWPIPRPHPTFLCNALIAFDDFDEENGATYVVPHSHKNPKAPSQDDGIQVPMKSGSALFWDGGLWHGGGPNISKDRERLGFFMSHQVWYLRPQENQLLSVPRDVAKQMPRKLQRLLGYHRFGLGVDGRDPVDVLQDEIYVHESARVGWRPE